MSSRLLLFLLAAAAVVLVTVAPATERSAAAPTSSCDPIQTTPVFGGDVPTSEEVLGFALGSREVTAAE